MPLAEQDAGGCQWRKSTRSANDGACVEVVVADGQIAVRDSNDPGGSQLRYPGRPWRDFIADVKKRERDQSRQTLVR